MASYTREQIEELKKADVKYFLHPSSSITDLEKNGPKIIVEGKGIYVTDVEGVTRIDVGAGLWLNNVGYGRAELGEVAKEQATKLNYFQAFGGYSHPSVIELAKKVAQMLPMDNPKVFFTSGGSESNDTAYKLARHYWWIKGQPKKINIISRNFAYHGVSCGALAATGLKANREGFEPLMPGFHHVEPPYCYKCPFGKKLECCNLECADAVEKKVLELGPETVAAFTGEPIMGTGGVFVPPAGYLKKIKAICDKYDMLYLDDEVICGFGRTGKWFAMDHEDFGVQPDIMMMAKGITSGYIPVGAVACSEKVFSALRERGGFYHGFTYSGHPVGCAVALKNLEIIEKENLVENAAKIGERLREGLRKLNLPAVGEVRGKGLINGIDLVKDAKTGEKFDPSAGFGVRVTEVAWEKGLVLRNLIGDISQIAPPLIITEQEVDLLVERLGASIQQAYEEFIAQGK
ncbi:MAG: aspartate aminotransferase family protein [Desulfitobacteriaceae bacterium]|nr:aspartate aminotransferase family protein [Desulfitobacteriaceae bacterium]